MTAGAVLFSVLSFGLPGLAQTAPPDCRGLSVFTPNTLARYFVPKDRSLETTWMLPDFKDDDWPRGPLGIGYDTGKDERDPICRGLVLHATMDRVDVDAAQRIVRDVSGPIVHDGNAVQSLGLTGGQVNEALLFERGQVVTFKNHSELEPGTGDFTVAIWVRTLGTGPEIIATKGGLNARNPGWAILSDDKETFLQVVTTAGGALRAAMPRIPSDRWTHLAFLFDRTRKQLDAFTDGELVTTVDLAGDPIAAPNADLTLGLVSTAAPAFIGFLDEFTVWNVALARDDVTRLFQLGRDGRSLKTACDGTGGTTGGTTLYAPLIGTDVTTPMRGVNPSIYIRIPFALTDVSRVGRIDLGVHYDDGFVAYLNGVEVARRNAGSALVLPFNAASLADRPDTAALTPEVIPLSSAIPLLVPGNNVLAIQGLNAAVDAVRFVIRPSLCVEDVITQDCVKTTEGRDFWLAFPGNAPADTNNPLHLTVCIAGVPGTTGRVQVPGLGFNQAFVIPANGAVAGTGSATVELPPEAALEDNRVVQSKGVHVTADRNVAVYATSRIDYSTDTFLALPTPCLDRNYLALGYKNVWRDLPILNGTQFGLVGVFNGTRVRIDPGSSAAGGSPFEIVLNTGETYLLRNTDNEPADLSGASIRATAPVGVFAGHRCANINGQDIFFCNLVLEQLLPLSAWGLEYITAPLSTRVRSVPQNKGDTLRVIAGQDATFVTITDDTGVKNANLNAGQVHEQLVIGPARVVARAPVLAGLYSNSSDFDLVTASDPFMALVQPVPAWMHRYVICAPPTPGGNADFEGNYINIIAPSTAAAATIRLNGAPVPGFQPIGATGRVFAQVKLASTAATHLVESNERIPFGLTVYGYSEYDAYGYPGGFASTQAVPATIVCGDDVVIELKEGCSAPIPDLRGGIRISPPCDDGGGEPEGFCFEFEDVKEGSSFTVGQTFPTSAPGQTVTVEVQPFFFSNGQSTSNGFTRSQTDGDAGHTGIEMLVNNVNLFIRPPSPWPGLSILYGEFGGNINLSVNGIRRNEADFTALHGATIGGALVTVLPTPGTARGEIRVDGSIRDFAVGGQELVVDHLCVGVQPQNGIPGGPIPGDAALASTPAFQVTQEPPAGTVLPAGEHEVTVVVRDGQGRLVGTCTRRVRILDLSPVKIECPKEMTVTCEDPRGARVFFDAVRAFTERCGQPVRVECKPESGSLFPPGTTLVRCVAIGPLGDRAECTFPVLVECGGIGTRRVTFTRTPNQQLQLSWQAPGFLEVSDSVRGPWTPVADAPSGHTVDLTGPRRFFRVRFP